MNIARIIAIAGAVLAAPVSANATLTQVGSLVGGSVNGTSVSASAIGYLALTDAVGTTYAAGTPATYAGAGQVATITASGGNVLERDQVANAADPYLDSNFADGTQLIAQCGYAGLLGGCNPAGATTIAFAAPTLGFTLSADDFDTAQSYTFTVQAYGGSTLLGTLTAASLADNGASPAVLAAVSTTPVTSLVVADAPTAGGVGDGDFVLANIGTVPEPASILLLGSGLAGLGLLRRRVRG